MNEEAPVLDAGASVLGKHMDHPWKEISLETYEAHMSLASVMQLQTMNRIMKYQFEAYPVSTAMIFGVAGGNGLEHVRKEKYRTVYGVDINEKYLQAVAERFAGLGETLQLLCTDLTTDYALLPSADLVIANLLIEYTGYPAFQKAVLQVDPEFVSCVIQLNKVADNADSESWVSESPYLHAFDGLNAIHHQTGEQETTKAMNEIGYVNILQSYEALPNGKQLMRLDYQKGLS